MGSECCKCHSEKNAPNTRNTSILSTASSNYIRRSRGGQRTLPNDRFRPYKSSLAIRQLTFDDAGHYSAESEDSYGTSMLASIDLSVQKRKPEVPVFLKRLHDTSVKIGSRTRFLVEIESVPPLKITWYHDNQALRKNERLNFLDEDRYYCLDVGWTLLQDEGHWTCIAENKHGCSVSSAYLTILVPKAYKAPRFVDELKAILAEDGTVSLECKVIGVPTPTLHWYKDGKKIKAGDTFALRANSADSSSLGTYSCVAKNCLGQAFSSSSVHVHSGGQPSTNGGSNSSAFLLGPQPKFIRELQNVEAQIETQLTLSCQVVVPPWPKTIDWYNKNGRVLENEKYKCMADGLGMYELQIKKVEMADEGEWKCVATSFFGIKAITSCYVAVTYPKNYKTPKFLENLRAVMTPEGLVSFECKVIGYPTPQLKWLKDGRELKPGDVYQLTGTNSLGTYCCIAKNSMGEISSTTVLTLEDIQSQLTEEERLMIFAVNQPPYFVKGLSSLELQINDEHKFHVQVSAKPDPKIFWYRNDELIEKDERLSMLKEEHGNFFLQLKRVELKDQAEWKAIAINDYGQSVTSCFVKLLVPKQFKMPRFLEDLKATLTKEGTVNLECKVIGVPKPELRWYKDGKYLKPGEMHRILSGTNGTCRLGIYTCEALNCMGVATSSASLLAYEEEAHDLRKLRKSNTLDILSIITEERSSQLNNSDKSVTYEEAAGVSFSFDGKEVSISLYETPDLTEEEALQIVEMYANELTEHITDQNVVELPSLRFVKETVTSGNILMEATVIDVLPNEPNNEDELKTEADVENSMMDDSAFLANSSIISEIDKNPPHRQSTQSLNEALFLKSSTESLPDTRNALTISPKASPSMTSLKTETIDELSEAEYSAKKTTPLYSPASNRASIQKRLSFDSEDDSLYEFEKRKTQKKLLPPSEAQPTLEKIESINADDLAPPDKKDLSVLESVALSISTMELDLDKIQNDLICSKDLKEDVTNYTLNVLCSLLQPIHEIKTSLETIESRLSDGDDSEKESIVRALCESVTEFRNIVSELEKTIQHENDAVFHNRRQSILDAVVEPLNELDKGLRLIGMEHLKRSTSSLKIADFEENSDHSSNDSSSISVRSDARKMIVILNEYNKELENLNVLIQQKRNSVQHDGNMLKTLESLDCVVQQLKGVRDWSSTLHENSLQTPSFGSEHMEDILDFNGTVLQFLDTNINVVKAALQTSTGFSQINQFLDNTSSARVNLETTLALTSKLSPISTINYLIGALKTYTTISNQFPRNKALLQDVLVVNPDCIKSIDDSIEIILNSLETIEKCSQVENLYHKKRILLALYRLKTPVQHLAITLRSVEKQIAGNEDDVSKMTGLQVYTLVNVVSEPLQMVRKEIGVILNDCQTQEHTHETIDTLLSLVGPPLRDFQDAITAFHDIIFTKEPESIDANYVLSALNNLNPPLCELANNMMKAEELILQDAPVVTDARLGIRIVMQSVSGLIKAIFSLQADSPENHAITEALSRLNEPLMEIKNNLKDINDRFYEEDPEKVNITMLKTLSTPFNLLQKELIDTSNVLSGDIKNTIGDLQRTILTIQDQVSFEYGDEPASIEYNIMTLQTLLQPLNVLRNHCIAIKECLHNEAAPLAHVIDSLEKEQIQIINDIDHLLSELMKEPSDQQFPPNLHKAINSTFHFLKKYKALLTALKEPDSIQNATLSQNVRHVLQRMHSDFDKIEQNIESEELRYELEKIVSSVLGIEEAQNPSSLHSSLQSLSSLTPVFSKILLELEVLSKVDIQDVDSVECFIAFLQSLNTLRTLQDNVRNFQSTSNTDSIQIPMLFSFLGSCERLEVKVSELLTIIENCADRNVKLDSQFYKRAIESFRILNNQLIHLNKCLIDQSMSDDNQKEIPFEMSINAFTVLLSTINADAESSSCKEIQSIIQESIIDELKRLRNDILFNMSLIQSEDEITFNDSEQYEHSLPTANPDLVGVCLKSMKDEVKKCNKYFDKMDKTPLEQKISYINGINLSLENIYNILNFINRNVSLEGEEIFIKKLQEPVLHMLQQVHQIKVFSETSRLDTALGLNAQCNILPMLNELNRSFQNFKTLLASSEGNMSSSEASSSVAISHISRSDTQEFQPIKSEASEDMTDSIYNDLSSSTNTESVEYITVKPNQVLDSSISEADGSIDEKSLIIDSSSPSSDILSDLKGLIVDNFEGLMLSNPEIILTTNEDTVTQQNESVEMAPCKTITEESRGSVDTSIKREEKINSSKEELSLLTNETSGYHSKALDNITTTDQSSCSTMATNLEEGKESTTNTEELTTVATLDSKINEISEASIGTAENMGQVLIYEADILQSLNTEPKILKNDDLDDMIETSSDDSGKTVVTLDMLQATTELLGSCEPILEDVEEQQNKEGLELAEFGEQSLQAETQLENGCKVVNQETNILYTGISETEFNAEAGLGDEQMIVKVEFPEERQSVANAGTEIEISEIIEPFSTEIEDQDDICKDITGGLDSEIDINRKAVESDTPEVIIEENVQQPAQIICSNLSKLEKEEFENDAAKNLGVIHVQQPQTASQEESNIEKTEMQKNYFNSCSQLASTVTTESPQQAEVKDPEIMDDPKEMDINRKALESDTPKVITEESAQRMCSNLSKLEKEEFENNTAKNLGMIHVQQPQTASQEESNIEKAELLKNYFNSCSQSTITMTTESPQQAIIDGTNETDGTVHLELKTDDIENTLGSKSTKDDQHYESSMITEGIISSVEDQQEICEGNSRINQVDQQSIPEFEDSTELQVTNVEGGNVKLEAANSTHSTTMETTHSESTGIIACDLIAEITTEQEETNVPIEPLTENLAGEMQCIEMNTASIGTMEKESIGTVGVESTTQSQEFEKPDSVTCASEKVLTTTTDDKPIEEIEEIDHKHKTQEISEVCQSDETLIPPLTKGDTLEEYWDTKDDEYSSECSSKQHKLSHGVLSEQESFETAMDDMESSHCDELADWENISFDKDSPDQSLLSTLPTNESLQAAEVVEDQEAELFCKFSKLGDENVTDVVTNTSEEEKFTVLQKTEVEKFMEIQENVEEPPKKDLLMEGEISASTDEVLEDEVLNSENELVQSTEVSLDNTDDTSPLLKKETIEAQNINDEIQTLEVDGEIPLTATIHTAVTEHKLENQCDLSVEVFSKIEELPSVQNAEESNLGKIDQQPDESEEMIEEDTGSGKIAQDLAVKSDFHRSQENLNEAGSFTNEAILQKEMESTESQIVDAGNAVPEIQDQKPESMKIDDSNTALKITTELLRTEELEFQNENLGTDQLIVGTIETPEHQNAIAEQCESESRIEETPTEAAHEEETDIQSEDLKVTLQAAEIDTDTKESTLAVGMETLTLQTADLDMKIQDNQSPTATGDNLLPEDDAAQEARIKQDLEIRDFSCKNKPLKINDSSEPQNATVEGSQFEKIEPEFGTLDEATTEGKTIANEVSLFESNPPESKIPQKETVEQGSGENESQEVILLDNESLPEQDKLKIEILESGCTLQVVENEQRQKIEEKAIGILRDCPELLEMSEAQELQNAIILDALVKETEFHQKNQNEGEKVDNFQGQDLHTKIEILGVDKASSTSAGEVLKEESPVENPGAEQKQLELPQKTENLEIEVSNQETTTLEIEGGKEMGMAEMENISEDKLILEDVSSEIPASLLDTNEAVGTQNATIGEIDAEVSSFQTETSKEAPAPEDSVKIHKSHDLEAETPTSKMNNELQESKEQNLREESVQKNFIENDKQERHAPALKKEELEIGIVDDVMFTEIEEKVLPYKGEMGSSSIEVLEHKKSTLDIPIEFLQTEDNQKNQNAVLESTEIEFDTETEKELSAAEGLAKFEKQTSEIQRTSQESDAEDSKQDALQEDRIEVRKCEPTSKMVELETEGRKYIKIQESDTPQNAIIENSPIVEQRIEKENLEMECKLIEQKECPKHQNGIEDKIEIQKEESQMEALEKIRTEESELISYKTTKLDNQDSKENCTEKSLEEMREAELSIQLLNNKQLLPTPGDLQGDDTNNESKIIEMEDSGIYLATNDRILLDEEKECELIELKAEPQILQTDDKNIPSEKHIVDDLVLVTDPITSFTDCSTATKEIVEFSEVAASSEFGEIENFGTTGDMIKNDMEIEGNTPQDTGPQPETIELKQCATEVRISSEMEEIDQKSRIFIVKLDSPLQMESNASNAQELNPEEYLQPVCDPKPELVLEKIELGSTDITSATTEVITTELQCAQKASIIQSPIQKVDLEIGKLHPESHTSSILAADIPLTATIEDSEIEKLELINENLDLRMNKTKILEAKSSQNAIIEDSEIQVIKVELISMDTAKQIVQVEECKPPMMNRATVLEKDEVTTEEDEEFNVEDCKVSEKLLPHEYESGKSEKVNFETSNVDHMLATEEDQNTQSNITEFESKSVSRELIEESPETLETLPIPQDICDHKKQMNAASSTRTDSKLLEKTVDFTTLNVDLQSAEDLVLPPSQLEPSLADVTEEINPIQDYKEKVQKNITQAYVLANEINTEDSSSQTQDLQINIMQVENVTVTSEENSIVHKAHKEITSNQVNEQKMNPEMAQAEELSLNKIEKEEVHPKEVEEHLQTKVEKNIVLSRVKEEQLNIHEESTEKFSGATSDELAEQGILKDTEDLLEGYSSIHLQERVAVNLQPESNDLSEQHGQVEEAGEQAAEDEESKSRPANIEAVHNESEQEELQIKAEMETDDFSKSIQEGDVQNKKGNSEITAVIESETTDQHKKSDVQENPSITTNGDEEKQHSKSIEPVSSKAEKKEDKENTAKKNSSNSIKRRKSKKKKPLEKEKIADNSQKDQKMEMINTKNAGKETVDSTELSTATVTDENETSGVLSEEIGKAQQAESKMHSAKLVDEDKSHSTISEDGAEHSKQKRQQLNDLQTSDHKNQMSRRRSIDYNAEDGEPENAQNLKGSKREVESEISTVWKIRENYQENSIQMDEQKHQHEFRTQDDFKKTSKKSSKNIRNVEYPGMGRYQNEMLMHNNHTSFHSSERALQGSEDSRLNTNAKSRTPELRYYTRSPELDDLSREHRNNCTKPDKCSDCYHKYSSKAYDIPYTKSSLFDEIQHKLKNISQPEYSHTDFHHRDHLHNKHSWQSKIPFVKISQVDHRHAALDYNDNVSSFLGPDHYYCSRASSADRSSKASSVSRDYSNEHLLSPTRRQRYSTTTSDDFDIEYRPVSAPPYLRDDAASRPSSPICKPLAHRRLHFRDDIHLDYNYLRGRHCNPEFKHIPRHYYVPRHHMYLHSNYYRMQNSSFSYEFYHPKCPYCRILYLRYRTNNWSDYLQREENSFSTRGSYYRPHSWDSNVSLSSRMRGYQSDEDVLDHVHSRMAGTGWASHSDFRKITPGNDGIFRSKEAEDLLSKHFWDDKHPTHVYFSNSYTSVSRPQSSGKCFSNRIPYSNFSTTLSPRFKQLHGEDTVPVGATAILQVEVEGTPKPNIEWLKGERRVLPTPSRYRYIEDRDLHTLVISDVSHNDAGRYRCKVWNKYGVADAYTSIDVVTSSRGKPPRFITRPETIMCVNCGSDLSVSFRMTGDPRPRVSWMKGLTDITETQRTLRETVNDYIRFTLKRAQISDAGTYFIIIKNTYGTDRAFFTLRVNQRSRSLTPAPFYKSELYNVSTANGDRGGKAYNKVPGPVPDEPCVTDFGKHCLTLSWRRPLQCGGAPIMAYRVEKWLVKETGGGKWIEVGMTPTTCIDVYNLNPGERYDFRVAARNQYGWGEPVKTTAPILFENITEFPEFERCLPGELKVLFDTTAELECQVKHSKGVEIEWLKDGNPISADDKYEMTYRDGRSCLKIRNLNDEDSGRYVCEATNKHGKICTFVRLMVVHDQRIVNANLRINRLRQENDGKIDMAPSFSMRLRNRRIQMCYPVRLTCQVRGFPRPTVVWYKDGNRIEDNQYFTIHEEADDFHSLEINNTKPDEHSGTYSIVATNSSGTVSCKCELIVDKGLRTYIGPKFVDKLDRVYSAQEGSQLRLRAVVCAYPAVGVTWQKNGVPLRQSRRIIVTISHEGEIELTIAQMKQQDSGVYTCTAVNEVGSAETNTRIEVYPRQRTSENETCLEEADAMYSKEPKFLVKPRSFKAAEGDHVIIDCQIIGDPKPSVTWLRDRLKLDYYRDFDEFKVSNEESASFEYKLEIARVKFDHTGTYTVTAANEHGEIKAVISLQVYSKDPTKSSPMKDDKMKHSEVQKMPKIKRHLSDIECCDGDSITFECEAETEGDSSEIDFHWYRNGKLIPLGDDFQSSVNGNVASLIIEQVYAEDEGQYSCIVSNELGTATSTACLIVNVLEENENRIHSHLEKPSNLQSRSKSPMIDYLLPMGRDSVSSERVTQKTKSTVAAAKFQTVPSSKVVEEGETVRFQCTVVGNPVPATAWDKYNVPVKTEGRVRVREQNDLRILEITDVTIDDEGLYRVTIENEYGRSEATARLDIINHRRRHANSVDNRVYEKHHGRHSVGKVANVDGTCAISCGIPDASSNGSAVWYKNGEMLTLSPKVVSGYRDSAYQLQFSALSLEDSGVYTCIVENESGKTRCSAELIVLDERNDDDMNLRPPVFTQGIPQKLYANEGKSFEFRVKLQGEQPMQIMWFKNDEHLPDCNDFEYVNYEDGEYGLRLQDAFLPDSGLYRCEAYNCHGDAQTMGHLIVKDTTNGNETDMMENGVSSTVDNFHKIQATNGKLDMLDIPGLYNSGLKMNGDSTPATFIEGPSDRIAMRGESVALTVKYFGNPEPTVRWTKAGREIIPNERISLCTKNGESVLRFETVTGDDCGKYEINVENTFGIDTYTTSLAVEGPPDAPNGQPNVVAGDRTATVTWCSPPYDGGSKITGYSIEMRSYSNSQWRTAIENCDSFFCTIRGLIPGETYMFRVRAENVHGLSGPSVESMPTYITHADVCSPTVPARVNIQSGEIFANQFEVLEELGKGKYGIVHRVRDKEHGSIHAAKFARCIKSTDKEKVREEVNIMNALRHPKLLQLISAYENNREIIMLTEYISGGELFERVVADDFTLTERDCILFMRQICEGVAYIHKNNVVHLDLKPENIMCVSWDSHQIKLIDFGLAQKITPDTPVRVLFGTPEFIPPEIINYEPIGTETDMWSVGVICYVLLSGLSPFMGNNDAETFANITRAEYDFNDEAFCAISQDAKDFISALLVKRKEKRLTAKQCLHHKWLAQQDKTMSCVKLCTDKLKKFIIRRKWQKTGNALRAISRMATASRRSSSANSSSSNSSRVSVSGASGTSETYSSRMSSLGEDDNVLLNNGHHVGAKVATKDDSYDADKNFALASPARTARKSVAFKNVETSDDEKVPTVLENGKQSRLDNGKKLNGESCAKETIPAKVVDASKVEESSESSCKNVPKMSNFGTPSRNSVSEMIGRLKESSAKGAKVGASTGPKTSVVSGSLKNGNNYFCLNRKSTPAIVKNGDVSNSNNDKQCKVELIKTESKSKCVDVNQNIRKTVEPTSSTKCKTSLDCADAVNKTYCNQLSDTVNANKTAERLKKFERLSSTPPAAAAPAKPKKETPVSANKSNFEKAYAFWNRD